nr:hypothetical protein [Prevotella sp.]
MYKKELSNKYVQQKNKVRLADQSNMLVFTASFNNGRRYHAGNRKLNNSDREISNKEGTQMELFAGNKD